MNTAVHTFKLRAECQFCGKSYLDGHQRTPLPPYGLKGTPDEWIPMIRHAQADAAAHVCHKCMLEIAMIAQEVV